MDPKYSRLLASYDDQERKVIECVSGQRRLVVINETPTITCQSDDNGTRELGGGGGGIIGIVGLQKQMPRIPKGNNLRHDMTTTNLVNSWSREVSALTGNGR